MVNEIRGLRPCYRILVIFVKKEVMRSPQEYIDLLVR